MLEKIKPASVILKPALILAAAIIVLFISGYLLFYYTHIPLPLNISKKTATLVKNDKKTLLLCKNGAWEKFIVAGVVLEDTIPGGVIGKDNVTYDMYMEWFSIIDKMNANTIQVNDIMGTEFYRAFYDYNSGRQEPLYLLQGITLGDEEFHKMKDAYSGKMEMRLSQRSYYAIDVVHGSSKGGKKPYVWDISDWVLAYIVGDDWNPELVLYTNDAYSDRIGYNGKFISASPQASAFETVLARIGDHILSYETRKYKEQRLLGYANWPMTDPLFHDVSWNRGLYENIAHVNIELITPHDTVKSGIFAAYHIEPNYPSFLSFDPAYSKYIDDEGKRNPYRGYLEALNKYHRLLVVVCGFGVPSSRGVSNIDQVRCFNQGKLSEKEQGKMLQSLYNDIMKARCAGGCIISWCDAWGKTAWNTSNVVDKQKCTHWSDAQTSSQAYGLVAYEPGQKHGICYVDGNVSEWENDSFLIDKNGYRLQMKYDEKYVYFHVQVNAYDFNKDAIFIPLDITPNSGAKEDATNGLSYDRNMDFVIMIQGEKNSKILVQEYYNSIYALYGETVGKKDVNIRKPSQESGKFDLVRQYVRKPMFDGNGEEKEAVLEDSGTLRYGNSNPTARDYDSLSDFMVNGNDIEIRIPWLLLNFSDPSNMMIHDDYYRNYGVKSMHIKELYASLTVKKTDETIQIPSGRLELKGWGASPSWYMRLKKSYYYVQDIFSDYLGGEDWKN